MIPHQASKQNWLHIKHPDGLGVLSAISKISKILLVLGVGLLVLYFFNNRSVIPAQVVAPEPAQPPPIQIKIPALQVDAPIVNLGLNADRTLAVPQRGEDVGWYVGSAAPGAKGPAVLVGHLDWRLKKGVFWNLNKLNPGDEIQIIREDMSVVVYRVTNKETYSQDAFPTEKVYNKTEDREMRLITCSGAYSLLQGRYSDNLVIYASMVN